MHRFCPKCNTVHNGRCTRQDNYIRRERNSEADKLRNTTQWRRTAAQAKKRDYYCCRICAEKGIHNTADLSVHHIVPLSVDGSKAYDLANVITVCRIHHEQCEKGLILPEYQKRLTQKEIDLSILKVSAKGKGF